MLWEGGCQSVMVILSPGRRVRLAPPEPPMLSKLLRTEDWMLGRPPVEEVWVWPRERLRMEGGGAAAACVVAALVLEGVRSRAAVLTTASDQPYSMFETPPERGSLLRRADQ